MTSSALTILTQNRINLATVIKAAREDILDPFTLTVGTRGSRLARYQTKLAVTALRRVAPNVKFAVQAVQTQGDRDTISPLATMGRGVFVGALEAALLDGRIDLAVHSLKDLPTEPVPGLVVIPVLEREDPRDVLLNRWGLSLAELPAGARVGTSSPRREAQLRHARQDLEILPLRGNVETRVAKASGVDYDGVVLAAAGLVRLGLADQITEYLSPSLCTPAPGQGALALELREVDQEFLALALKTVHPTTAAAVEAERWVSRVAGSGCTAPLGAYATVVGSTLHLCAVIASVDGSTAYRIEVEWPVVDPEGAGKAAYDALLVQGAGALVSAGDGP